MRTIVKIVLMAIADYASVEPQTGKLNILGVFDRITVASFPATHYRMYLALKFESDILDATARHSLSIALTGEDGNELFTLSGQLQMPESPPGLSAQLSIVCELNQLAFQNPGDYRIYVSVDDDALEESAVLQVVEIES